jgi:hypothetical protein
MSTAEAIRVEREEREACAKDRAAKLQPGDYYADGVFLKRRDDREFRLRCETHWDACLVLLALGK